MTLGEIIAMAREAELVIDGNQSGQDNLIHFATLVAERERDRIIKANAPEIERVNAHIKELEAAVLAEREECAKVCEKIQTRRSGSVADDCAAAIRARGQV